MRTLDFFQQVLFWRQMLQNRSYSDIFYFRVHKIPFTAKIQPFYEIYGSHDLRIDLSKESVLFVSLKSLILRSCISATKGCQDRRISSVH